MSPLTPQQQEELGKIFDASFARDEAREAIRRKRSGEVVLCLERSSDDPEVGDEIFQKELGAFCTSLHATGLNFSQIGMAFDSVEGGGFPLPEFVLIAQAFTTPVAALCGAWIQARYGRKVRLKIGDVEAEGRTVAEIDDLLQRAKTFQEEVGGKDKSP